MESKQDDSDAEFYLIEETIPPMPKLVRTDSAASTTLPIADDLPVNDIHLATQPPTPRPTVQLPQNQLTSIPQAFIPSKPINIDHGSAQRGLTQEQFKKLLHPDNGGILQKKLPPASVKSPVILAPLTPGGQGYSIANAFGVSPPFPGPLTITGAISAGSMNVPTLTVEDLNVTANGVIYELKTDTIASSSGEIKIILENSSFIDCANQSFRFVQDFDSLGTIHTALGISFAGEFDYLNNYREITGDYYLATSTPFVDGSNSGTFILNVVGRTYTLTVSSFSGGTNSLSIGQHAQPIYFLPDITANFPARGTTFPININTSLSNYGSGCCTTQLDTNATLSITDSDAVSVWQWQSATVGQGWNQFSLSWVL